MTIFEFDNMSHHANMWVIYKGDKHYVISSDFTERLFALTVDKENVEPDEWSWVRCENVELIKNRLLNFPAKQINKNLRSGESLDGK